MVSQVLTRSGSNSRTNRNLYCTTVILIVITTLMCLNSSTAQRVNCRKFVFAPICRGTASKRAPPIILPGTDENDIYSVQDGKLEVEAEYPMMTMRDNDMKKSKIREILQRQRRRYKQMDQLPKAEAFDPSIYDY